MLASLIDEKKYLAMAAQYEQRIGPRDAEMVPGVEGKWLIVRVEGGREQTAAAHLVGRRFGVFLPQYPWTAIRRGRKVEGRGNLFPGYLFVFVWGVQQHIRRILAVPGVMEVMMCGDHPVIVPDRVIDDIRAEENRHWPMFSVVETVRIRKRRKKYSQHRIEQQVPVGFGDIVSVRPAGWIKGITDLEDDERIGALKTALGLAS